MALTAGDQTDETKPVARRHFTAGIAAWSLRRWLLLVGAVALVIRLPLIATAGGASWSGDTAEYMALARDLLHGSFPSVYRVPGYPVFIVLCDLLPGSRTANVITMQHLLGVGVACLILVVGWRSFGRVPGIVAASLAALTPVALGIEHTLQPDFLFGAAVLVGVALLIEAIRRPQPALGMHAAAGLAFATAVYIKPVGEVLPAAAALSVLVAGRRLHAAWKPAAVVAGVTVLAIAPWLVRNAVGYGTLTMSNQGGQTLFKRVFDIDHRPIPVTTADGRRVAAIVTQLRAEGVRNEINNAVSRALQRQGETADQAVDIEGRVAATAIKQDPLGYAARTLPRLWKTLTDVNSFTRHDLTSENSSTLEPSSGGLLAIAIDAWFWPVRIAAWVWWIAALSVLSSLLLWRSPHPTTRRATRVILLTWLFVAAAIALSHGGMRRYSAEIAPLVWLAGSAGAVLVVGTIWRSARGRLARRPGA